jgi:hypothetical protein
MYYSPTELLELPADTKREDITQRYTEAAEQPSIGSTMFGGLTFYGYLLDWTCPHKSLDEIATGGGGGGGQFLV